MSFGPGAGDGFSSGSGSGYGVRAFVGFGCLIVGDSGGVEDGLTILGDCCGVGARDGTLYLGDGDAVACKAWATGACEDCAGKGAGVASGPRGVWGRACMVVAPLVVLLLGGGACWVGGVGG